MFKFAKTLFFIFLTLGSPSIASMAVRPTCPVCYQEEGASPFFKLSCGHECCLECISGIITAGIENRVSPKCPLPECARYLNQEELGRLVSDSSIMKKLQYLELVKHSASKLCPTHNCLYAFINEDVEVRIIECPECHQTYCCQCLRLHDPKISCKKAERRAEMEEEKKSEEASKLSKAWIDENSRPCPKCKRPLFKDGGCNKVTCPKCGTKSKWNPEKKH